MGKIEPPPAKQMRYNLRSSVQLKSNEISEIVASNRPVAATDHSTLRLQNHENIIKSEVLEPPRKREIPNLLTLNPDDLLKMLDVMNFVDLFSIAETCLKLYNTVKHHFRLKHNIFDFASMFDGDLLDVDKSTKSLCIFGNRIHTLKISRDLFNDDYDVSPKLLKSISDNCRHTIQALELDRFDFGCNFGFLCDMKNLKALKLNNVEGLKLGRGNFNKLEVVELNHLDIDEEDLTEFIRSVRTIKRLSIVKCCNITTEIFGHIKSLKNLEEFEFQLNQASRSEDIHRCDLMHLITLKKLKVLKLNCDYRAVQQLIDGFCENKIAIEHLELAHGLLDVATVEAIAKLKTIKVLKFNNMILFADYFMLPIASGLNQLEELYIKTAENISRFRITEIVRAANCLTCLKIDANDFYLTTDTHYAIISAVQNRTDKNHLTITIYGDAKPVMMTKGPNEKWLKVNQFDRYSNHLFPLYVWTPDEFDSDIDFDDDVDYEALTFD